MRRTLIPGLCLVASLAATAGQPPIVISAGRTARLSIDTPASIRVVDRAEIEASAATSLAGLLAGRGLHVSDRFGDGSDALLDLRGFGAAAGSNTLVLVDGRPLNNASDLAPPDLSTIDLGLVERVEIVQGSAGVLYGNQAVGGLVNIVTRRPEAFAAALTAGGGSYDGYEARARLFDRMDNGLGYRVSARKRETDNYREQNHSDLQDLGLRLDYDYGGRRLFFEQEYHWKHLQVPGSLFSDELAADRRQAVPDYRGDFTRSETLVSRLGLRQSLWGGWYLEGEVTYRENHNPFKLSFRGLPGQRADQNRYVWTFNPRLVGVVPLGTADLRLTLGADYEDTDYGLRTAFGPQRIGQRIYALYGQGSALVGAGLTVTGGLRWARVENGIFDGSAKTHLDDEVGVGSLGLSWRPAAGWRLFARWDQNYRFAKVDEHTNVAFGQPTGIKNQTGDSYEAGAVFDAGPVRADLTLYRLILHDEIAFDSSTFFNINLDRTRRDGAIVSAAWRPAAGWRLGGDYTYTEGRITDGPFDGERIPLVPRNEVRLYLDHDLGQGFGLRGEWRWVDEQVVGADFANDLERLDAYAVLDLVGRYRRGPWSLDLRLNNLLDERYAGTGAAGFDAGFARRAAFFPAPERNFWLTATYGFD